MQFVQKSPAARLCEQPEGLTKSALSKFGYLNHIGLTDNRVNDFNLCIFRVKIEGFVFVGKHLIFHAIQPEFQEEKSEVDMHFSLYGPRFPCEEENVTVLDIIKAHLACLARLQDCLQLLC